MIAQDLGDKAKVVLFDSRSKTSSHEKTAPASRNAHHAALHPTESSPDISPELLTELMFGTVPLSYKGTSVRLHPLPVNPEEQGARRNFLFTKVFSVKVGDFGAPSSSAPTSGTTSLSSSYQSTANKSEYPFPTMTPIQDDNSPGRVTQRDRSQRERSASRGAPNSALNHQRQLSGGGRHHERTASGPSRAHERRPSGGDRNDRIETTPHFPFTKTETSDSFEDYFSGWCPSPGPTMSRRRRSIDTTGSLSPNGHRTSRYQSAMCAVGVIFSVPGDGQEHIECLLMTRYWQMITRATYAMQRVIYDELESALGIVAGHGIVHTPRTKGRSTGEARVYQRGKKYYVALGQDCLSNNVNINMAADSFCARLTSGVSLPEIQKLPLAQECDALVEELNHIMYVLDRKECKFLFSILASALNEYIVNTSKKALSGDAAPSSGLRDRILIVSDDTVLARRFIFCIARLFFRSNRADLHADIDYALIWPSTGLLGTPRKELLQRRQDSIAKATRLNKGWDIPGHRSLGVSPLAMQDPRPSSTSSNVSSKNSSWIPSLTWFANGSRLRLGDEGSARSDQRTMQTSWDSSDFDGLGRSVRSRCSISKPVASKLSPSSQSESEDETESQFTYLPIAEIGVSKHEDGAVDVDLLSTVALWTEDHPDDKIIGASNLDYPLTGLLSRFHPDMFLQAIPQSTYNETIIRDYLGEEELYSQPNTTHDWTDTASITIAEAGHLWRVRKLTRITRPLASPSEETTFEESWRDETLTYINDDLIQFISDSLDEYARTKSKHCIERMLESLAH